LAPPDSASGVGCPRSVHGERYDTRSRQKGRASGHRDRRRREILRDRSTASRSGSAGAMTARFIVADVFDGLASIEDGTVDLVVTSPPFIRLRSYLPADHPDKDKEIGH